MQSMEIGESVSGLVLSEQGGTLCIISKSDGEGASWQLAVVSGNTKGGGWGFFNLPWALKSQG